MVHPDSQKQQETQLYSKQNAKFTPDLIECQLAHLFHPWNPFVDFQEMGENLSEQFFVLFLFFETRFYVAQTSLEFTI